jgi:hypothetical protein
MSAIKRLAIRTIDAGASLLVYPAGHLLRKIRSFGLTRLPACRRALNQVGVFPIREHYYEPQFKFGEMRSAFSKERALPGIDWKIEEQVALLGSLRFGNELARLSRERTTEFRFYLENPSFGPGDAEFWYQLIRLKKPRRIFEIGSGNSTLLAMEAIARNRDEDSSYSCKHVCIEPYEARRLEGSGATVIREKVEDLDVAFFSELEANDILFIDSSHVIRPAGDVLYEYLQLLPTLRVGVIVHIHDIFSPRNYPPDWIVDEVRLWNEQYLVEAFLTHNDTWGIIAALNLLRHRHFERLREVAPFLTPDREPGSFYIQKTR